MIVLTIATWLMVQKDETLQWREYQREANDLKEDRLRAELAAFSDAAFTAKLDAAGARIKSAAESQTQRAEELAQLEQEIASKTGELDVAVQTSKFQNAQRDVVRAQLDLNVRDAKPEAVLDQGLSSFGQEQVEAETLVVNVQRLKAELEALKARRTEITQALEVAKADQKKLIADRTRLEEQLSLLAPNDPALGSRSPFKSVKRDVKEWPILNAFNPHLKIQYDWPSKEGAHPEIQLGMARVQRVDRCRTCHTNINDFTGSDPTYPHGDAEHGGYAHPHSSHPHPELFLSSTSPHPIEKFGCTICHLGDGSGTSFQNAEHTASNPAQAEHWHEEFGWHSNHFWEQPMLPNTFVESTCIKCHHQVVELGVNAKHGATAPKVYEGYSLIKEYGCYGCHPVNGYDGTSPIGPDLRLEPQTEAEALAIAADPNQTAGRERKVGPSLRHVAQKVEKDFLSYWTEEPKRFRPDTRMPQFFHLSNQEDHLAELLQPVELAGIAAYLEAKSVPLSLLKPKADYQADAARGKTLFAQRGCLACHSHDDTEFAGIKQTFGPNLSKIHQKIKPGEEGFAWLYTWLKNPTLHHPRTRMPNLYLDPEEKGGNYVDPAADIAAFLLTGGPTDFPTMQLPGVYLGVQVEAVDGGVRVTDVLPDSPAERARAAEAGTPPSLLLGDVITAINGQPVADQAAIDGFIGGLKANTEVELAVLRGRPLIFKTSVCTPLDDLVRMYLGKALPAAQVETAFAQRQYPVSDLAWQAKADGSMPTLSEFIKGDEVELAPRSKGEQVSEADWETRKLQFIGKRTISRYGCYGCHDIPGFEEGRPIGTALQDWGRKDTSQLALEHIEEYLHHHGEPDGKPTSDAVEEIIKREFHDGTATHDEKLKAFFYESLQHHGRPGFIWQKLREPRSYDHMKTATKGWDERLRMPKFPFTDPEIEAVATFVLGLVADPPEEPYLYQPDGPAGAIVEGERLLAKFNCGGCHILDMPGVQYNVNIREFAGLTRPEIVGFLTQHAAKLADGTLTQAMLAGRETVSDELWGQLLASVPADKREAVKAEQTELLTGLGEFIVNCETLLEGELPNVGDLTTEIAPLLGRLALSRNAVSLEEWLDEHPETLIADSIGAADYADAIRLALKLKPPAQYGPAVTTSGQRQTITFHGLQYSADPDFGEDTYDLWENLDVGGRYKLSGINSRFIANEENPVTGKQESRGGSFMIWLYNKLASDKAGGEASLMPQFLYGAQQSSPPPLYKEGVKVQTPWLYQFLKNPEQIRYTTVLRMPQFNMSDAEAQSLANYFAAIDGVPFPYQDVQRREPAYLQAMQQAHQATFAESSDDYLTTSWKLLNANQCIKCHAVGGRKYQAGLDVGPDGQPKDIQGPNLKRVQDRLRPDWTQLWVYNPKWVTPYTSMPANLPRDQKNFPELYGADGHWQNPALVDALMNYSAIYERLGTVVYDPAKAAGGGATTPPAAGEQPPAAAPPAAAPADAAKPTDAAD
jgi:mono/diheme cytochrome c family protein